MQYKIPVQIENEDPIVLWLSLKQLIILLIWGWIWYSIFKWLVTVTWPEVAALPALLVIWVFAFIALFKISEMTFFPFLFNFIRQIINTEPKRWVKWVDSFQPIDIWYITKTTLKQNKSFDTDEKQEKIKDLNDKIKNI